MSEGYTDTEVTPAGDSPAGGSAGDTASRVPPAGPPEGNPGSTVTGAPVQDAEAVAEGGGEVEVERDLDELAAKAIKADEYLLLAQRTKADFENYRKRATRDAALAQERGIAKLAKELLPAIDNLDRAVLAVCDGQGAEGTEDQLLSGIRLVHAEVLSALGRAGIEPFSPAGEPFDPQWHEAVAHHHIEGHEPGTVIEVYQQGYRFGEAVLRPARVLVAA